jgi:TRAP-type C4-dicarboxylate transport system permease small subunit
MYAFPRRRRAGEYSERGISLQNILGRLESFNARLISVFRYLLGVIVFLQVVMVFVAVVFRYILNRPLFWSDELATFLLVYITFFGCFIASSMGRLARMEFGVNMLGPFKKYAQALSKLASLSIVGVVSYYGFQLLFSPIIQRQKSPAMRLPMSAFFWVVPVLMSLVFYTELIALIRIFVPREPGGAMLEEADKGGTPLA